MSSQVLDPAVGALPLCCNRCPTFQKRLMYAVIVYLQDLKQKSMTLLKVVFSRFWNGQQKGSFMIEISKFKTQRDGHASGKKCCFARVTETSLKVKLLGSP